LEVTYIPVSELEARLPLVLTISLLFCTRFWLQRDKPRSQPTICILTGIRPQCLTTLRLYEFVHSKINEGLEAILVEKGGIVLAVACG
jgi:hypothetical protein